MSIKDKFPDKYRTLLDDEMWAFIEKTENWYPEEAISWPIEQTRENYNAMCEAFAPAKLNSVSRMDRLPNMPPEWEPERDNFPIRHYRSVTQPNGKCCVIYLHGGGYVVGNLESHDDVCAEICDRTGFDVWAVDYALAPEFSFPTDILEVRYIAESNFDAPFYENIIMCGDSAGANLAASASHLMRRQGKDLAGQVLIYPGLASELKGGTFVEHANAPLLSTAETEFYKSARVNGDLEALNDPLASPLNDHDFSNLPPTVVFSAQCDPLCGDGDVYCQKIKAAGGRAHWVHEKGLVHGYLRARHSVTRARESFDRIIDSISMLGRGEWYQ